MARFHFNIHDGANIRDEVGSELADAHEAQLEAIRLAGSVIREEATRIRAIESWCMEVTDHEGSVLFTLDFCLRGAPALQAVGLPAV